MYKSIEVVDDFYAAPSVVRDCGVSAVKAHRPVPDSAAEFGLEFPGPSVAGQEEALRAIKRLVGAGLPENVVLKSSFALSTADAETTGPAEAQVPAWTALVWLTPADRCAGGISFYRGPTSTADGESGLSRETFFVAAKYNRMVLFAPSAGPHNDGPGCGYSPESARLVQIMRLVAGPAQ